ncbi:hypothetical protein N340_00723, partial [Tauraco erythrolophus]
TGSAGLDVETTVDSMLISDKVVVIVTNVKGSLGEGLSALLIGRSSTSRQGIFVLPGVIDADYTGIIKIMVYTLTPPVFIPKGSKIAQLVPCRSCVPSSDDAERGEGGFGSTGPPEVYFALDLKRTKPEMMVTMLGPNGVKITRKMLIDPGTDVTIIA